MNSRGQNGLPESLAIQVMESANGVGTMTAMMLANPTGDPERGVAVNRLIPAFADCLPTLLLASEIPHTRAT